MNPAVLAMLADVLENSPELSQVVSVRLPTELVGVERRALLEREENLLGDTRLTGKMRRLRLRVRDYPTAPTGATVTIGDEVLKIRSCERFDAGPEWWACEIV